jgi:hypothetical protein
MPGKNIVSLAMACLIIGAQFVSLCPASQSNAVEIHLIVVPCKGHECNRTPSGVSHSCKQEGCNHDLCNDKSLIESFKIPHQDHFYVCTLPVSAIVADLTLPANPAQTLLSSYNLLVPFPQVLIPLRI